MTPFDTSTVEVAKYAAKRAREHGLIAVAGGGDTVAALNHAKRRRILPSFRPLAARFLNGWRAKPFPV